MSNDPAVVQPPGPVLRGRAIVHVDPDYNDGFTMDLTPVQPETRPLMLEETAARDAPAPAIDPDVAARQATVDRARRKVSASGTVVHQPAIGLGRPHRVPGPAQPAAEIVRHADPATQPGIPDEAIWVSFDLPGLQDSIDVSYAQVVRSGPTLALCYDNRVRGTRFLPKDTSQTLGVRVSGVDVVMMARPTGHCFTLGNHAICVLEILSEEATTEYDNYLNSNAPEDLKGLVEAMASL